MCQTFCAFCVSTMICFVFFVGVFSGWRVWSACFYLYIFLCVFDSQGLFLVLLGVLLDH